MTMFVEGYPSKKEPPLPGDCPSCTITDGLHERWRNPPYLGMTVTAVCYGCGWEGPVPLVPLDFDPEYVPKPEA